MWIPDRTKLVKVLLHADGIDVETPWAEDLGPVHDSSGARRVRLGNVPFLHAKPTYEDVIVVEPNPERGFLTWDSRGVPWEEILTRIDEDSERWVMIVDYEVVGDASSQTAFSALDIAGEKANIAVEGDYGPKPETPGRAYLAVPKELGVSNVMLLLEQSKLPLTLRLVHPVDE